MYVFIFFDRVRIYTSLNRLEISKLFVYSGRLVSYFLLVLFYLLHKHISIDFLPDLSKRKIISNKEMVIP